MVGVRAGQHDADLEDPDARQRRVGSHRTCLGELGDHLPRAVLRGDQLVTGVADRQQPHRQVGDTGVGELLEARQD